MFFTHLGCTFHAVKSKLINRFPKKLILVKGMMFLFRLRALTTSENELLRFVPAKREPGVTRIHPQGKVAPRMRFGAC